ncbi:hypothetical protein HHX47_DHR7000365 [Lentinula edodes]|nr:hypothetical protein HHX47_DHR7000365 [Lentinula edodes]
MFRRKDNKIYGVLNDFDLSSRVADMDKGPTSNQPGRVAISIAKPGLPTAEPRAYSKWFSGTDEEVFVKTPSLPHPPLSIFPFNLTSLTSERGCI